MGGGGGAELEISKPVEQQIQFTRARRITSHVTFRANEKVVVFNGNKIPTQCGVLLMAGLLVDCCARVSDQNGVSPLYIMFEIHHSGREPWCGYPPGRCLLVAI